LTVAPILPPTSDFEAFHAALAPRRRLLGFDVGSKTLGLALSDTSRSIASPLETLRRTKFTQDIVKLQAIAQRHEIGGFVIGLPVNMDGTEGPRAQSARSFAENLQSVIALPVAFWDERLSTAAVTRMMIEADTTRARRAELVDKLAAAFILQGALDRLKDLGLAGI
jgi:putative Holliday junction resolvase